jgi:Uma2 family endonuclease
MVSVLEIPAIRRRVPPISVEDYHRMGELGLVDQRTELIRGVIVEKLSKSPLHESLVHAIFVLLLKAVGAGYLVRKEGPLTLSDSEPEPDVSVVLGNPADYRRHHPTTAVLAVEVAVSSVELDREKLSLYAEAGVTECWFVLAERRVVEVLRNPLNGGYLDREVLTDTDTLRSRALPQIEISLKELFADL